MSRYPQPNVPIQIIDHAAGLFARNGLEGTSLQQIADKAGYTKAGVLHHFESKRSIYDAVMRTAHDQLQALREKAEDAPVGVERDRKVIELSVDLTFAYPGLSAYSTKFIREDQQDDPELLEISSIMMTALGIDPESVGDERLVRVTSAFTGLGLVSLAAMQCGLAEAWRPHIVAAAMDALGH